MRMLINGKGEFCHLGNCDGKNECLSCPLESDKTEKIVCFPTDLACFDIPPLTA